ncbi:MAG: AraC family transcriptional regulator [Desulfobacterales bacterium]|nr:AraC family transcriptional regulator [Desulfobacterales bacterium]
MSGLGYDTAMPDHAKELTTYHFRPAVQRDLPFEVIDYATLPERRRQLSLSEAPHRHSFFEIYYITRGSGTHFIDFEPYPIHPPVFFFISPGQVHCWELAEALSGKVLLFTEDFMVLNPLSQNNVEDLPFFYTAVHHPLLELDAEQQAAFEDSIREMEGEFTAELPGRGGVLRAQLYLLLVRLMRIYAAQNTHRASGPDKAATVRRFKHLIAGNLAVNQSVQAFAGELGISASRLGEITKEVTGLSPGKLLNREIALEAKRLLAHSDMSAAEIGYSLEFEDPSYFGRFFKRETGRSPRQFREEIRKKYQFYPE